MADINISEITNKYEGLSHTWSNSHSFVAGESLVKTMADSEDSSNNAASTAWVNRFFENRIPTTPTINVPLLTPMWFDHELTSNAWVKSDYIRNEDNDWGWLYASETKNSDIYAHLVLDLSGGTSTSETVSGTTIAFTRATDGHKIIVSSNSANLDDTIFNDTGIAWYYVLDTANKRFKLPRSRYGFQGIKSDNTNEYAGTYDTPGLPKPSITSTDSGHTHQYKESNNTTYQSGNSGDRIWAQLSDSNTAIGYANITSTVDDDTIYKSTNSTVQPPATEMLLYFSTGDENSSIYGGGGGVGGGVIDGTVLDSTDVTIQDWSAKTDGIYYTYTVKNDCLLNAIFVHGNESNNSWDAYYVYVDDVLIFECNETSNFIENINIPVKRGTIVKFKTTAQYLSQSFYITDDSSLKMRIKEFALNSLAPQIAMPDWDSSLSSKIESGDIIDSNGWLNIYLPRHGGTTYLKDFYCYINGIMVGYDTTHCPYNIYFNYPSVQTVPVSKGDIVTFTTDASSIGDTVKVTFYPCKTVQQSNPPVYITKREHGNYANLFDSNATYAVGDYVKTTTDGTKYYIITTAGKNTDVTKIGKLVDAADVPTWCYTLYSDGYCEQSGIRPYKSSIGLATETVTLKKAYIDTTYVVILTSSSEGSSSDAGHSVNEVKGVKSTTEFGYSTYDVGTTHDGYTNWKTEGYVY